MTACWRGRSSAPTSGDPAERIDDTGLLRRGCCRRGAGVCSVGSGFVDRRWERHSAMSQRTDLFGKGRNKGMGGGWRMKAGGEVTSMQGTTIYKRLTEDERQRAIDDGDVITLDDGSHVAWFSPEDV